MITASSVTRRAFSAAGLVLLAACSTGVSPSTTPAPGPNPVDVPRTGGAGPTPLVPAAWPVRTNEAVDL